MSDDGTIYVISIFSMWLKYFFSGTSNEIEAGEMTYMHHHQIFSVDLEFMFLLIC